MYFPAGINQGLAAALRAPPSGLFIALVIQIPAVTALTWACHLVREEEEQKTGLFKPVQESPVVDLSGHSSYLLVLGHGTVALLTITAEK